MSPLSVTVSDGKPLRVTVKNNLDRALQHSRLCVDGIIYQVGALDAGSEKVLSLQGMQGIPVRDFARGQSSNFYDAGQYRRETFGSESSRVKWDLPLAASAACFITQMNNEPQNQQFVAAEGLDLSRYATNGSVIFLAWDGGQTLTKPLNKFTSKRGAQNSLLRVVIPGKLNSAPDSNSQ